MSHLIPKIASFCLVAAALGACSLNPPKPIQGDGLTAGQYRAAYAIASARCDRQTNACSSFSSHDQCVSEKFEASAEDARLRGCSHRVDQAQLSACVSDIERNPCGSGIAQLEACQQKSLCPYTSNEGTL